MSSLGVNARMASVVSSPGMAVALFEACSLCFRKSTLSLPSHSLHALHTHSPSRSPSHLSLKSHPRTHIHSPAMTRPVHTMLASVQIMAEICFQIWHGLQAQGVVY